MAIHQSYTEKDLLRQIAQGSEAAFRSIFNSYRPRLYTYILRLSKSRETAEDVVHDVFLKIWENREGLTAVEHFGAYLFQAARHHAYNCFRRRAKEILILDAIRSEQSEVSAFEGEDKITIQEVKDFIRLTVEKMTPQQKQVFRLSREKGLKHEEIATQLNITTRTVSNHLSDALRLLREEISIRYGSQAIGIFVIYCFAVS